MKNFLKKHWWVILIVVIGFGLFYWFQLRPISIKKECNAVASDLSGEGFKAGKIVAQYTGEPYFDEALYEKCLREHGIDK